MQAWYIFRNFHSNQKRIDSVCFPRRNRSVRAVLIEYKLVEDYFFVEEILQDGIWQLYTNLYMTPIINAANDTSGKYSHIKIITVRVLVFTKTHDSKWIVKGKEFSHSLEQAGYINTKFSQSNIIKDHNEEILGRKTKELKDRFRKECLDGVSDIYQLIESYEKEYNSIATILR